MCNFKLASHIYPIKCLDTVGYTILLTCNRKPIKLGPGLGADQWRHPAGKDEKAIVSFKTL